MLMIAPVDLLNTSLSWSEQSSVFRMDPQDSVSVLHIFTVILLKLD